MNIQNQRGINVITLSVAIIILVLITSVLVYSSKDGIKIRNLKDLYNDIKMLDNKISAYYLEHGDIPKLDQYTNLEFLNTANAEEINPNNGSTFYVIDLGEMDGITLNYGKDFETIKEANGSVNVNELDDLYIVNEASHTVYYPKGINLQGIKYHTYGEEWKEVELAVIPIETAEQFAKIGSDEDIKINGVNYKFSLDGTYVLKNDIDLSGICYKVDGTTTNDKSWIPIGKTEANAFKGKLYGNGHVIRGIYINTTSYYQGLFGYNNGTIQDITVEGLITSTNSYIGGITGKNKGNIINSDSKVITKGKFIVGGFVGENHGKIYKCKNYKKVEGTLENTGSGHIGGITGINDETGSIECSYNEGNIIGKSNCAGGISGINRGIVNLCINNANIENSGAAATGGVIGYQSVNNRAKTTNCYNLANVNGKYEVGGIIGWLNIGSILNCYNIAKVTATENAKSVLGKKTNIDTIVRNNFYLSTLLTTDSNATPKTMVEMKSQVFVDLLNTGQVEEPWAMDTLGINDGYPVLKWQMEELE